MDKIGGKGRRRRSFPSIIILKTLHKHSNTLKIGFAFSSNSQGPRVHPNSPGSKQFHLSFGVMSKSLKWCPSPQPPSEKTQTLPATSEQPNPAKHTQLIIHANPYMHTRTIEHAHTTTATAITTCLMQITCLCRADRTDPVPQ